MKPETVARPFFVPHEVSDRSKSYFLGSSLLFFFTCLFCFRDRASLCIPSWPGTRPWIRLASDSQSSACLCLRSWGCRCYHHAWLWILCPHPSSHIQRGNVFSCVEVSGSLVREQGRRGSPEPSLRRRKVLLRSLRHRHRMEGSVAGRKGTSPSD